MFVLVETAEFHVLMRFQDKVGNLERIKIVRDIFEAGDKSCYGILQKHLDFALFPLIFILYAWRYPYFAKPEQVCAKLMRI